MNITDFIQKTTSFGVKDNIGLSNTKLKEGFLDFLYELLELLSKDGCKANLNSGNTTSPEYKGGSALFISFADTECYYKMYSHITNLKKKYPTVDKVISNGVVMVLMKQTSESATMTDSSSSKVPEDSSKGDSLGFLDTAIKNVTGSGLEDAMTNLTSNVLGGIGKSMNESVNNPNNKLNREILRIKKLLK